MSKIDVLNSLFHGITNYEIRGTNYHFNPDFFWSTSLFKLKNILETGCIMTRANLFENRGISVETDGADIDSTAVSIAFHPKNDEFFDMYKKKHIRYRYREIYDTLDVLEYAFHTYLKNIVLVLDPMLLRELKIRRIGQEEWTGSMPDEIQIEQDIPARYIIAVALKERTGMDGILIQEIRKILEEHKINVPIVSLETGYEYGQSIETKKVI